jgi:hypothetical protein
MAKKKAVRQEKLDLTKAEAPMSSVTPTAPEKRKVKKVPALSEAQLADLLALPDGYPRRPDASTDRLLCEAREAIALVSKHRAKLVKKAGLDKAMLDTLKTRREALRVAEHAVRANLERSASRSHGELRKRGRSLVSDCVAALEYFAKSAEVESGLAKITRGEEDASLIEDLRTCAQLLDQAGEALAKADLPKNAADKCRATSIELSQTSSAAVEPSPFDHEPVRNRAYWYLRDAVSEVAAAGRYVYRDDPKRLLAFTALR